jgi:hypothetical protein
MDRVGSLVGQKFGKLTVLSESGFIVDDDSTHITSLTMECYVDKDNPRTEINVTILEK